MLAANDGQQGHAGSGLYSSGDPLAVAFNASLANQDALLLANLDPRGRPTSRDEINVSANLHVDDYHERTLSFDGQACSLQRRGDVNNGR